jgi:hypothetical protein
MNRAIANDHAVAAGLVVWGKSLNFVLPVLPITEVSVAGRIA